MILYHLNCEKDMKTIRLIELFGGIGAQASALSRMPNIPYELYKLSEWEVNAVASYKAIHCGDNHINYAKDLTAEQLDDALYAYGISTDGKDPMSFEQIKRKPLSWKRTVYNNFKATNNLGSICNFHGKDLQIVDKDTYQYWMFYSYPCLTGDMLVLTDKGFKQIKDVANGDMVLSHDNEYHKITASAKTGTKNVYRINCMAADEIRATGNHPFYARKMVRHYPTKPDGKRTRTREFLSPEWIECKNLDKTYYLGFAINQKSVMPKWDGITVEWKDRNRVETRSQISNLLDNKDFWWLIGRYLGDGWKRTQGGIVICANDNKKDDLVRIATRLGFVCYCERERTINKIHFPYNELGAFVESFGYYAHGKKLPGYVFDMPVDLCRGLIEGYLRSDGCFANGKWKITSVSRELIYGIGQLVAKVYHQPFSIYKTERPKTCVIEGRTVNQRDSYTIAWKDYVSKQDKAFYEDGYIWMPIKEIVNTGKGEDVYDLTIEDSHSFTANGVIVHNCQDLSVAGKQQGMQKDSGTRSGLLWEVERLLNECDELPQVLIMENVPQVHGEKFIHDFTLWLRFLEKKGYHNFWQDLNAKNYGVAQNRDRTFCVSFLDDVVFNFPKPIPLTKTIKDYLETDVDEKYYINSEKAQQLIDKLIVDGTLPTNERTAIDLTTNQPGQLTVANCIKARYDAGISNFRQDGTGILEQ